jgi:uncharacterized protein YdcH (DUF465 family)
MNVLAQDSLREKFSAFLEMFKWKKKEKQRRAEYDRVIEELDTLDDTIVRATKRCEHRKTQTGLKAVKTNHSGQ